MSKLNAAVFSLNDFIKVVSLNTHGCNYTCPAKLINGEWFFKFKNEWHLVDEYAREFTTIISDSGKGIIERKYK